MERKSIGILAVAIAFFIVLFSNIIFSNSSSPFETPKNCSYMWNNNCSNDSLDDSFLGCDGMQYPGGDSGRIEEVYINASTFFPGENINVTCKFHEWDGFTNYEYIWYNNDSTSNANWIKVWNNSISDPGSPRIVNNFTIFTLNSSEGTQIVRCIWSLNNPVSNQCANSGLNYDNDDVNFTVTSHLTYDFWNLTNYTNGSEIASGQTYTRNDSFGNFTYINVSALWNKNISFAQIEHNGNGSFFNYTICSPCSSNWINYTLNLSNRTDFNKYNITIKSIHVNDTYGLENSTSPELYFYLNPGIPPNLTIIGLRKLSMEIGSTTTVNLYDHNVKVIANASDDVGLSEVKANITYPLGLKVNGTMIQEVIDGQSYWTFMFNNSLPINETGFYNIGVIAVDIGGQEKVSGIDDGLASVTIEASNNYSLNVSNRKEPYMKGENVSFNVTCWNDPECGNFNWTYNITKINETFSNSSFGTIFNYTIKPDDLEGNYSIFVNASLNKNSGVKAFEFNVSKNLSLTISTSQVLNPGNAVTFSVNLYNARNELHNSSVNANITCSDGMHTLTFSSGQASYLCTIPSTYSTLFTIFVNASDQYNNSGENYTNFTTADQVAVFIPSGGGGSVPSPKTEVKNCTDGTLYSKCSTTRPLYCSNGTLISKCSVCKCESGYSCQLGETCILTKAEDFNFTIGLTNVEIEQGKDFDLKGYLANTGNTILNLSSFLSISNNCCNVSLPSNFILNEKEEKEFTISIHVPLFTNTSDYWIKIGIGTKYFNKEKLIDVKVVKSSYYSDLSELKSFLTDIEKEVQEYKKAGIDTRNVDSLIEKSKSILNNVNSSISKDQVNVLSGSITDLKNNINYVSTSLTLLRGQRFLSQNSWLIILLIISSILTIYFVPEVLTPLQKIDVELKKLKEDEKTSVSSRVETEKQYFTRKIDENMFTKIMLTKQDNILKLKGAITEKEKDRKIILSRASPVEMLKWFGRGIKNLPRNIKNLFVGAYRKIKVPRISLFKKQNQK